jgi:RNA polymerase sigma-70 factor (ECF subfamily)
MAHADGSTTDVSLLFRLNHDPSDQDAWGRFVDRYGAKVYGWCRAWRLQEADARDLTQAVLAKLAVQLRRFAYDPSQSFRGWLRTLAMNAHRDWLADRERAVGVVGAGGLYGDEPLQNAEAREDLARRLEEEFDLELLEEAERRVRRRVADHTWEAYRLTAIEGLAGAEAAARLGMKVAAVFVSKSHVMKHLQDEVRTLEREHDETAPPPG